jgi:hypothetical protein
MVLMDVITRHTIENAIVLVGGLIIAIGLIGNRSKIPGSIFCWRLAALLCVINGIIGLSLTYLHTEWMYVHYDEVYRWRGILGGVMMGMLFTLLINWWQFESNKKATKP